MTGSTDHCNIICSYPSAERRLELHVRSQLLFAAFLQLVCNVHHLVQSGACMESTLDHSNWNLLSECCPFPCQGTKLGIEQPPQVQHIFVLCFSQL